MKTLVIMRHAHAVDEAVSGGDFARPLKPKGVESASKAADWLVDKNIQPNLLVHSPAARTTETAHIVSKKLAVAESQIVPFDELYQGHAETILNCVRAIDNSISTLLTVSHNPGVTEFLSRFSVGPVSYVPPAGVAIVSCNIENWQQAVFNMDYSADYRF